VELEVIVDKLEEELIDEVLDGGQDKIRQL
jgi:hypothetical protein